MDEEVNKVVLEIIAHVDKKHLHLPLPVSCFHNEPHFYWRVGSCDSSHIINMLFGVHNVSRENGEWIYRKLSSNDAAKKAVKGLINSGMSMCDMRKGDTAYAYRIDSKTIEGRILLTEKVIRFR